MRFNKKGLEEVGKGFINLGNLFLVLFVLNVYMQQDDIDYFVVLHLVYISIAFYIAGYKFTSSDKSDTKDN